MIAIEQELHNHQDSIDGRPEGTIDNVLPIPVLTLTDSMYVFNGFKKKKKW